MHVGVYDRQTDRQTEKPSSGLHTVRPSAFTRWCPSCGQDPQLSRYCSAPCCSWPSASPFPFRCLLGCRSRDGVAGLVMELPSFRSAWLIHLQRLLVTKVLMSSGLLWSRRSLFVVFLGGKILWIFLRLCCVKKKGYDPVLVGTL